MTVFRIKILLMGAFFGVLLTKSQVISWYKIRDMFYFREPDLYLIMGSAIATSMLSLLLIRKFGIRGMDGKIPAMPVKRLDKGKFLGGFIFGVGWFLAGTCPGPIYAQIGTGEFLAFLTLAGALAGAFTYSRIRNRLPR